MRFSVLGVDLDNISGRQAAELLETAIDRRDGRAHSVFIVNAHTLNLAASDPDYQRTLNAADYVLADGTGVRWAAQLQGVPLLENLNGTDFLPTLLGQSAGRRRSYFMLGADWRTIGLAADYARNAFPQWHLAGCHHGYLGDERLTADVIAEINRLRPDLLLVGMGNPIQERWIAQHLPRLDVAVCMGVGGLFDFWAGNVSRAPKWLRRCGQEWLWRLYQQPLLKARRYIIGNPLFLARVLRQRWGV